MLKRLRKYLANKKYLYTALSSLLLIVVLLTFKVADIQQSNLSPANDATVANSDKIIANDDIATVSAVIPLPHNQDIMLNGSTSQYYNMIDPNSNLGGIHTRAVWHKDSTNNNQGATTTIVRIHRGSAITGTFSGAVKSFNVQAAYQSTVGAFCSWYTSCNLPHARTNNGCEHQKKPSDQGGGYIKISCDGNLLYQKSLRNNSNDNAPQGFMNFDKDYYTIPASCRNWKIESDKWASVNGYIDIRLLKAEYVITPTFTPTPTPSDQLPKGNHGWINCSVTGGWTCDADNYSTALNVHFYRDTAANPNARVYIGQTTANIYRADLVAANVCGGTGNHGFKWDIPTSVFTDFGSGTMKVYAYAMNAGGANPKLPNSPRLINVSSCIPTTTPTPLPTATPTPIPTSTPTPLPTATPTPVPIAPETTISIPADKINTCSADWTGSGIIDGFNLTNLDDTSNTTNNPITVETTYTDDDGLDDITDIYIWLSNSADWTTNPKIGAFFTGGIDSVNDLLASGNALCVRDDFIRTECALDEYGLPSSSIIIGYLKPISTDIVGNTFTVRWKIGIIDPASTQFHNQPDLKIHSYVKDNDGLTYTPSVVSTSSWPVDLSEPNSGDITKEITEVDGLLTYEIGYQPTDQGSGLLSAIPSAYASNLLNAAENFTATSPIAYSYQFNLANPTNNLFFKDYVLNINTATPDPYIVTYTIPEVNASNATLNISLNTTDKACNSVKSPPVPLDIGANPWIMTTNGNVYSDKFNEKIIPDVITDTDPLLNLDTTPAFASTFLHLRNSPSLGTTKESFFDYKYGSYTDLNYEPRQYVSATSWITYIQTLLQRNPNVDYWDIPVTSLPITINNNVSDYPYISSSELDIDRVNAINIPGDLTINAGVTCNVKTIFIVENNLIINPNLSSTNSSGCMFVVKGTTIINEGSDSGSSSTQTSYDTVEAFIITDKINIPVDTMQDGLLLKGGLILDADVINGNILLGDGNIFDRNLRTISNLKSPSEIIIYDGTKYMYLFDDIFYYPARYHIREKQFIESSNL